MEYCAAGIVVIYVRLLRLQFSAHKELKIKNNLLLNVQLFYKILQTYKTCYKNRDIYKNKDRENSFSFFHCLIQYLLMAM